jgi:hypothetical protein
MQKNDTTGSLTSTWTSRAASHRRGSGCHTDRQRWLSPRVRARGWPVVLADLEKRQHGAGDAGYISDQGCPSGAGPQVGGAGCLGRTQAWLLLQVRPGLGDDVRGPSVIETRWEVLVGCAGPQRSTGLQSGGARATRRRSSGGLSRLHTLG